MSIQRNNAYLFSIILLLSLVLGGLTGFALGNKAFILKPLGDIFLNLIFTAVVPLVFFSVASSIAQIGKSHQVIKLFSSMIFSFLFMGIVAAVFMLCVVKWFPPAQGVVLTLQKPEAIAQVNAADQIVSVFTVSDFSKLLTHQNMLALIVFSILVGFATYASGEKGKAFSAFLQSGAEIFMKVIGFIMYYAPIGFFAYFAVLVADLGPKLLESYFRVGVIYYTAAILYFVMAFSFFAYLAGKNKGLTLFWKYVPVPMITSLATCSSAASIPANLQATKNIGIAPEVYETVVPIGSILHKDGSILGGVVKIAFLFGIFHMSFMGPMVLLTALLVALLVGTVMGAIPSGGMLGEMLILSLYGFPPQALFIIAAISIIIDPIATMLNVTGNTICSMLVGRLVEGKKWVTGC